jgi:hypothetical protein
MGIERDDNGYAAAERSLAFHVIENPLVSPMDAVEVAERGNGANPTGARL